VGRDPRGVSVAEVARLFVAKENDDHDRDTMERALDIPILPSMWRQHFMERLSMMQY
jgi:hypothetical protein